MPNDIIHKWRHDHQNLSYLHKIKRFSKPDLPNSISIFLVFFIQTKNLVFYLYLIYDQSISRRQCSEREINRTYTIVNLLPMNCVYSRCILKYLNTWWIFLCFLIISLQQNLRTKDISGLNRKHTSALTKICSHCAPSKYCIKTP